MTGRVGLGGWNTTGRPVDFTDARPFIVLVYDAMITSQFNRRLAKVIIHVATQKEKKPTERERTELKKREAARPLAIGDHEFRRCLVGEFRMTIR